MMTFKVGPEYTIASHNGQIMDEWIGKTVEEFTAAMGRESDRTETSNLGGRVITEYEWDN